LVAERNHLCRDLRGCHLPFNFSLLQADWHARTIAKLIDEYESLLPPGGWPNWVLGNHDRPRNQRMREPFDFFGPTCYQWGHLLRTEAVAPAALAEDGEGTRHTGGEATLDVWAGVRPRSCRWPTAAHRAPLWRV